MALITKRTSYRTLSFAISVLIIIGALKLLNWIPLAVQTEELRKFSTIEEVKSSLKLPNIYIPAYFPEQISWPPAAIFAQKKPFVLVIMHFMHTGTKDAVLSIYQADAKAKFNPPYDSRMLYRKKESTVFIKNRKGTLVTAVCRGNEDCNRLSWRHEQFRITLHSDFQPEHLLKIAESMI